MPWLPELLFLYLIPLLNCAKVSGLFTVKSDGKKLWRKAMAKTTTKTMQKSSEKQCKKLRKTVTKKAAAATFHCIGITSLDGIR
ncbi:hypothetical protein AYI97_04835 [Shewanella algae]|nr:hypothetical protein AYI97_04835 [Shewanella algae]